VKPSSRKENADFEMNFTSMRVEKHPDSSVIIGLASEKSLK